MPRNWQFKPPKIGQYTAPAVEIVLVRFKTRDARILTQFLRQIFTQGAAKNISYKFVYPKNKEKNTETIGFGILFSITILHQQINLDFFKITPKNPAGEDANPRRKILRPLNSEYSVSIISTSRLFEHP